MSENSDVRHVSIGKIFDTAEFKKMEFIPDEFRNVFEDTPFILCIFIPGKVQGRINVYPVNNRDIKKLMVHLSEFTPTVVKKIADVLEKMGLGKLIFTTGICFENQKCYYESYLRIGGDEKGIIEGLTEKLRKIENVIDVEFINIE